MNTEKKEFGDFATDPSHIQDKIVNHPNLFISQMSREQRNDLLNIKNRPQSFQPGSSRPQRFNQSYQVQKDHQLTMSVGMFNKGTNSFLEFISNHSQRPLREVINEKGAHHYLNYNLSIDTWNLLVNKQIYMKVERLLLQKQITKRDDEERQLVS